jgi:hypothetical protein
MHTIALALLSKLWGNMFDEDGSGSLEATLIRKY